MRKWLHGADSHFPSPQKGCVLNYGSIMSDIIEGPSHLIIHDFRQASLKALS